MRQYRYKSYVLNNDSATKAVRKPCLQCALLAKDTATPRLCDPCEDYANQDFVSQKEIPLEDEILAKLIENNSTDFSEDEIAETAEVFMDFERLMEVAKITPMQKKVLRLKYEEDLNPTEIGKRLRISRHTVYDYLRRASIKNYILPALFNTSEERT